MNIPHVTKIMIIM